MLRRPSAVEKRFQAPCVFLLQNRRRGRPVVTIVAAAGDQVGVALASVAAAVAEVVVARAEVEPARRARWRRLPNPPRSAR